MNGTSLAEAKSNAGNTKDVSAENTAPVNDASDVQKADSAKAAAPKAEPKPQQKVQEQPSVSNASAGMEDYVKNSSGDSIISGLIKQAKFWHDKMQHAKAMQSLNRVLLSDPHNEEALYLMALWSGEINDLDAATNYRNKLAKISPNSSYIQMLDNQRGISDLSSDQLKHARVLAGSGNVNAALIEYQKLFTGATPPKALVSEYYLTMAGDPNYYDRAKNGIVSYIKQNPKDINAQVTYGKILTYRKSTIRKGIELLDYLAPHSDDADKALRDALMWLSPTEEDEKYYQKFLSRHANDNELRRHYDDTIIGNLSAQAYNDSELDKEDAIATFEKILKKNPNNQDALEAIGYLQMELKNYIKAKDYLTKAASLGGSKEAKLKHDANIATINLALQTGDMVLARTTVDQILEATPYDIDALLLKADICKKQKKFSEAEYALRTALSADSTHPGANEMLYYLYRDQGQKENAANLLASMPPHVADKIKEATAGKTYVDPIPPIRNKARDLAQSGQIPAAIETLQNGISKHPDDAWLRYDLARLLNENGFVAGAQTQVNFLTRPGADNEDLFAAASYLNEAGLYNQAMAVVKRITNGSDKVKKLRHDVEIAQSFGTVEEYLRSGNKQAAYNSLQMMQLSPKSLTTSQLGHLAFLYLQCGQKQKALDLADLASSRAIDPNAGIGDYADLVTVYNSTGYYDKARALTANQSIISNSKQSDLDKMNIGDSIRKADALREMEHYADAYDLLYPLIEQDPENEDLNMAMARLYHDNGEYAVAGQIYKKILKTAPNSQVALEGAINAALGEEDYDEATYLADRLVTSNDPRVLTLLAKVDAKNKNYRGAINKLTSARAQLDRRYNYPTAQSSQASLATHSSASSHMPGNPFKNRSSSSDVKKQTVTLPWEDSVGTVSMPVATNMSAQDRVDALNDINFMIREMQDKVAMSVRFEVEAGQKDGDPGTSKLKYAAIPVTFNVPITSTAQLSLVAEPITMDSGKLESESSIYEHGSNALLTGYSNASIIVNGVIANVENLRIDYAEMQNTLTEAGVTAESIGPKVVELQTQAADFRKSMNKLYEQMSLSTDSSQIQQINNAIQILNVKLNETLEKTSQLQQIQAQLNTLSLTYNLDKLTPAELDSLLNDPQLLGSLGELASISTAADKEKLVNIATKYKSIIQSMKGNQTANSIMSGAKARRATGVAFRAAVKSDDYKFDIGLTPVGKKSTNVEAGFFYSFKLDSHSNLNLNIERRGMRDSLLSYFGYKDDASGTVWGAVTKNGASLEYTYDDGYYGRTFGASAYAYRGKNVAHNHSYSFSGTMYVHAMKPTLYEDMTIGISLFYQNFKQNQNHFSLGNGGYFSPQNYLIASIPFTYMKRTDNLTFRLSASLGYQTYKQKEQDFYPNHTYFQQSLEELTDLGFASRSKFASKDENGVGGSIKATLDYYVLDDLVVGGSLSYSTFGEYKEMYEMLYIKSILGDL